MAYADFDLKRAVHTFGLIEERSTDLFARIEPLEPSEFLRIWLDEFAPLALGVNSNIGSLLQHRDAVLMAISYSIRVGCHAPCETADQRLASVGMVSRHVHFPAVEMG